MARHLTLVPAAGLTQADVRAALDGDRPLAVLPAGPPAAVDAAHAVLRTEAPLEDGTDLVVVTSGSTGTGRGGWRGNQCCFLEAWHIEAAGVVTTHPDFVTTP